MIVKAALSILRGVWNLNPLAVFSTACAITLQKEFSLALPAHAARLASALKGGRRCDGSLASESLSLLC